LVVSPKDPADEGFLGGTIQGREFWRGHRGCGVPGAKAFKAQCIKAEELARGRAATPALPSASEDPSQAVSTLQKKSPASYLKAEIYSTVRDALRTSSGIRTAEMKWTDHSKLSAYGIRLVGWPDGVPLQNPSTLSVAQNRAVLDALKSGSMSFVRLDEGEGPLIASGSQTGKPAKRSEIDEAAADFWTYEEQVGQPEPVSSAAAAAVDDLSGPNVNMAPSSPLTSTVGDPSRPPIRQEEAPEDGTPDDSRTVPKKRLREDA